jgi:hypothetical protein
MELGLSFQAQAVLGKEETVFTVPRQDIVEAKACRFKTLTPLPHFVSGLEADGSSLVIPYEEGAICRCQGKDEAEYAMPLFSEYPSYGLMSVYGIDYGDGLALAAIIEDGRLDCSFLIRTNWGPSGRYDLTPVFALRDYQDEERMPEDITIHYFPLSDVANAFVGIGQCYRRFIRENRGIPTLAEKIKGNAALDYSTRALSLRFRLGVKPLPVQILEQTPETQPPVKVFMSFDNVGKVVDECAKQGVGPCEFNLVGWNYGGHDGAFPQLFPVEDALGGEAKLHDLIERSHRHGYPMNLHDCYFDAYTLADTFDFENINRDHDGAYTLGGQYGGGQAYEVCPQKACDYALANFKDVARLGTKGAYYTDVLSVAQLSKCYYPDHPISHSENAFWWKKILGEVHSQFGVSYSEGARDWALPELDRAYLVALTEEALIPCIDRKVPLYQVAYHGSLIYNSFRGGVNAFPGEDIYLKNIAYGGMPILYYHHIFNPEWNADDGWTKDLTFDGPEKLKEDVAAIKRVTDDIARYADLQTEFIEDFIQHTPTLTETVYSGGARLFVNCADSAVETPTGQTVPAKDFLVVPTKACSVARTMG